MFLGIVAMLATVAVIALAVLGFLLIPATNQAPPP